MQVTRPFVGAVVLSVLACGTVTPDPRVPCTSQLTCDQEHRKVCEAGFCSPALPDVAAHLENLSMSLPVSVRLANPVAMRAAVLYPITPDGRTVVCPGAPGANQVAISGMVPLNDAAKFNLTSSMLETPLRSVSDTVTTGIMVNGPGRVVYVEIYAEPVTPGDPASGGAPVGTGCVVDAPYDDDPSKASVLVKIVATN